MIKKDTKKNVSLMLKIMLDFPQVKIFDHYPLILNRKKRNFKNQKKRKKKYQYTVHL
jgi:hypothetical protein